MVHRSVLTLIFSLVCSQPSVPTVAGGQEAPLRDIDGNVYLQVEIGGHTWMAENLRVTRYPDGETVSFSVYPDAADSGERFGLLYDWAAATRNLGSDPRPDLEGQGLCPDGWRLPTETDWADLINSMGGAGVAGRAAKAQEDWGVHPEDRVSGSGFNGLPAGFHDFSGEFRNRGITTFFLASTRNGEEPVTAFALEEDSAEFRKVRLHPRDRVSIRCLKRD